MNPAAHLVFVYGTLKSGLSNHHYLAGQTRIGPAQTHPGLTLFNLDGYPGMVALEGSDGVRGEVWSVSSECLQELDRLEGTVEGLFARRKVALLAPFGDRQVEAYYYLRDLAGRPSAGPEWQG